MVPFGIQNNFPKFCKKNFDSLGCNFGRKEKGAIPLFENKKFGVERCELHGWKALIKWSNFKKACDGLKLILFLIQWKMCPKSIPSLLLTS